MTYLLSQVNSVYLFLSKHSSPSIYDKLNNIGMEMDINMSDYNIKIEFNIYKKSM